MQSRRAKTARGRRDLKRREPLVNENIKKGLFIKGRKTSQVVTDVLNDLYCIKKPHAIKYNRKQTNSPHGGPFEDATTIEFFSDKSDASLFMYGSHSKKRPHNITIGRLFDYHILDMVELGISKYQLIENFKSLSLPMQGSKPCIAILGNTFQTDEKYRLIANLFVDFFRGKVVQNINLKGLDHVISLSTGPDGLILFRHYAIHMKKSGTRVPRVELEEVGPSLDLTLRRHQFGAEALRNLALRVPRVLKPKKKKNITTNVFHDKVGTVHVAQQKVDTVHDKVKKPKALRRKRKTSDRFTEEESDTVGSFEGESNKRIKTA